MADTTKHQKWLEWLDTYLDKKGFVREALAKSQNDYGHSWYVSWTRPQNKNRHAPANFITVRISNHPIGSLRALVRQDRIDILVNSTTKAEVKRQISNELRLQKALHLLNVYALPHEKVYFSTNGKEVRATFRYGHQYWQKKEFHVKGAGVAAIKNINRQIKEFMQGAGNA